MHKFIFAPLVLLTACASADPGTANSGVINPGATGPAAGALPARAQAAEPLMLESSPAPAAGPTRDGLSAELMYHILVAEIAGQRGDLGLAVEHYLTAATLSGDPAVAERATRIALFSRNDRKSLAAAQAWVAAAPDNIEARQVLAALLLRAQRHDEAFAQLDQVLEHAPDGDAQLQAFTQVASLLAQERDDAQVLALMRRLADKRPDNQHAQYALAHLALQLEQPELGLQAADRALRLRPRWAQAVILKAGALSRLERDEASLELLAQAVADQPDSTALRLYYARKLVEMARYADGARQFERLLQDEPDNVDARYALGIISVQQGEYDAAEQHFKALFEMGERINTASYFLGEIAEIRNQTEAAIGWYSQVGEGQYALDAQLRMAVLMARLGHGAAARQQLAGIHADSAAAELRLVLAEGEVLRELDQLPQAYAHYTQALERMPGNPQLLYARALIAEKLDRLDRLESDLRAILDADPDNAQALNALGYTLADRTDRHEEALKYTERAYALRPNDAAIMDSMGWVHYRLGNHQQALEYLQRAFDMLKDPEIAAHLGEVLWVSGRREEANRVWEQGLAENPDHELLRAVIERFAQ